MKPELLRASWEDQCHGPEPEQRPPGDAGVQTFIALSTESTQWLRGFRETYGRSPRVLHIGNIANNAYNNAKLLNAAGLDCDVICHDYYHIMGCPEWEDADFEGSHGDDFRPSWWRLDLHGFERSRWFAQGPVGLCLEYLIARREGRSADAARFWNALAVHNGTQSPTTSLEGLASSVSNTQHRYSRWLRTFSEAETLFGRLESRFARKLGSSTIGRLAYLGGVVMAAAMSAVAQISYRPFLRYVRGDILYEERDILFEERTISLLARFLKEFPERSDSLTPGDVYSYATIIPKWRSLFALYDIVQGYSTDPIVPLLAGTRYFAFEHGTLRNIPFQSDSTGRLTALAYRLATHVFVTNFDCLPSAHKLAADRVTFINHPFDESHGEQVSGAESLRALLLHELDSDLLFFFPTRQDWVPGTGYADKANDVFFRAFARLRAAGQRVGLVCCEWGANVEQSKQLVAELGCQAFVSWRPPMGTVQFERTALASDCVVDQFKLGAFGGVMFKSMAVGRVVCTSLNEHLLIGRYSELPPVLNCRTEEDIVGAFARFYSQRDELTRLGAAARRWMHVQHSGAETAEKQIVRYREHLERRSSQTGKPCAGR